MDAFTPQQTIELVSRIGCKKTHVRWDKLFWNSFMSGPLLGFGLVMAFDFTCILFAKAPLVPNATIGLHLTTALTMAKGAQ